MKNLAKSIVANIYGLIEIFRFLFLGDSSSIDKPLFLYKKEVRGFLGKYGQNGNHFNFKSKNKMEQLQFFLDYADYLKDVFNKEFDKIENFNERKNSPIMYVGNSKLFFHKGGDIIYTLRENDELSAFGRLGISCEMNIQSY